MLSDYLTKYFKSNLSAVFVTSISLILLQKVIPGHKNKNNNVGTVANSPFCKHFHNAHSWNPRDTTVPVICQWLKGHVNQDHGKLQAITLHISFALYYVSAYKKKKGETIYAAIFALNAFCMTAEISKVLSGRSTSHPHSLSPVRFLG